MAWRSVLVSGIAKILGLRAYNGARPSGNVWGSSRVSASGNVNADLNNDRPELRRRSRNAWQNHSTARAVIESDVALVVSTGIDVEPDTGNAKWDELLRAAWQKWAERASACGTMDLWTLQRQARRSEKTAGEFVWVFVDTDDFSLRGIPKAIFPVEADRLSETPLGELAPGASFCSGIEYDRFGKPIAYHIANEADIEDIRTPHGGSMVAGSGGTKVDTVNGFQKKNEGGKRYPAAEIIHGFDPNRPGQIRGEPGLAPILNTLRQEYELVEAELTAAKIGAAHSIKIKSNNGALPGDTLSTDGTVATYDFSPGSINVLAPGEDAEVMANPRPSQQISPFRQMLRGDISGATGIPQRYIDRDTSRSNYSSMRADMLDTQRILTPQQQRFGRLAAAEVYRRILPQLAVAAGVPVPQIGTPERHLFERCKIMPDGWAYVDPTKDVNAASSAINAGLTTLQEEIQSRGRDPRQVERQQQAERMQKAARDIEAIKQIQALCEKSGVPGLTWANIFNIAGPSTAPAVYMPDAHNDSLNNDTTLDTNKKQ